VQDSLVLQQYIRPHLNSVRLKQAECERVAVDLARTVDDDYVDRAVRGELEGQITENSANNQSWKSQVVDAIKTALPMAQEIWFHGSRATGKHRKNSDTDILVVVPDTAMLDNTIPLCGLPLLTHWL
jgi:hypothetical protein